MSDLGLDSTALNEIISIIKKQPFVQKAVIYGSRAKGNFRDYSDIDIALFGDITAHDAQAIASELDELPTAYTFDVSAFNSIQNPELKSHIERVGVLIYHRSDLYMK
jgi:predicted nucleotidyltransferase